MEEAADLLNNTASYLDDVAQYPEAEPLYQRALAIRERVLGTEHPETKRVRKNYTHLLQKKNRRRGLFRNFLAKRWHM